MQTVMIFVYLGLIFAALYTYLTLRMIMELRKRNIPVNFLLLRLLALKYVNQYKKITTKEQGHPGGLYHPWLISIGAMATCFAIAILIKVFYAGGIS